MRLAAWLDDRGPEGQHREWLLGADLFATVLAANQCGAFGDACDDYGTTSTVGATDRWHPSPSRSARAVGPRSGRLTMRKRRIGEYASRFWRLGDQKVCSGGVSRGGLARHGGSPEHFSIRGHGWWDFRQVGVPPAKRASAGLPGVVRSQPLVVRPSLRPRSVKRALGGRETR